MQQRAQIVFREINPSSDLEQRIRERLARFDRFNGKLTSCHVVVQAPHRHHQRGQLFDVRIQIRHSGGEVDVKHEGADNPAHADVLVAIRDAFDAAERVLEVHLHKSGRVRSVRRKLARAVQEAAHSPRRLQ
jgi:ribosome-associated translation inhibitor RaiA